MSFTSPDQFSDMTDFQLRRAFLSAVYELLESAVENGTDPLGATVVRPELRDFARDALADVRSNMKDLWNATEDLSDKMIFDHGLGGDQLRFKLAAVSFREGQYALYGGAVRFRWLLDTLEGLLDSIIDAAGVGGAVKEFKEGLRNSTEDE